MVENSDTPVVPLDNIRSLLSNLSVEIDYRLIRFRRGTRYENVRPSDVRVFVAATRGRRTISDVAMALNVTRQAVHASVKRLAALKILELQSMPGNQRDKIIAITERGMQARQTAVEQTNVVERELAEAIGREELEKLRQSLNILTTAIKARNTAEPGPPISAEELGGS